MEISFRSVYAFGIVPEGRARGMGEALVRHPLAEARAHGEREMLLEVIEQNPRAERLYARCGKRSSRSARGGVPHG